METAYLEEWVDLETGGEAVCLARAEASDDPGRREKWLLLAEVETRTKSAVMHFLRANGIAVEEKAEKRREGEARALARYDERLMHEQVAWKCTSSGVGHERRAASSRPRGGTCG